MANDDPEATAASTPALLPPDWEMVDWTKRNGRLVVDARRSDGEERTVRIDTLPMVCEADPLAWLKQVLDLELLWATS